MKYQKEELLRFKSLLEYFVAHLEYIANGCSNSSIGFEKYIKPLVDKGAIKYSGQGHKGMGIQKQVSKWDQYNNGQICINVHGTNCQDRGAYLNWNGTGYNIMANWKGTNIDSLYLQYHNPDSKERLSQNVLFSIRELGLFDNQTPNNNLYIFFDKYNLIKENKIVHKHNMSNKYQEYIDLLKANKNLILTGAPGTGKTYLAREIAKEMRAEIMFAQFHPSYDYTDFVEGLRPVNNEKGSLGFKRTNGIFKDFCRDAICKSVPPQKKEIEYTLKQFKKYLSKNEGIKIRGIYFNSEDEGAIYTMHNSSCYVISDENIIEYIIDKDSCLYNAWTKAVGDYIIDNYYVPLEKNDNNTRKYVFIIDEINRGEISKIFGELFFSIDPDYRGGKGRVFTQYQNLVEKDDVFAKGFYVPENVYIIGTMNDIDRSVESMDFAIRRRFTWKEVTPSDTESMLDELDCAAEAKATMKRLNTAIEKTEGLGAAYMIGPAYFLKLGKNGGDFNNLWKMNIEPLLKEYLRGFRRAKEILDNFSKVYFNMNVKKATGATTELIDED